MLQTRNPLRLRIPIIIFSLHALYFSLIQFAYLFLRDYNNNNSNYGKWKVVFDFPTSLLDLLWMLIYIIPCIPCILLAAYVLFLYKNPKSSVILSTVFFLIAFEPVYEYIVNAIYSLLFGYRMPGIFSRDFILFYFPLMLSFTFTGISTLKGLRRKFIPMTAITIGFIYVINWFVYQTSFIEYCIKKEQYLYITSELSIPLGTFLLLVALLLFVLRNRVVPIFTHQHKKQLKKISKMTPEHALKALKENFELGIISEEEYQNRRTEILEKL